MSDNDALPENKTPSTTADVSDKGATAPGTTGERFSEKLYLAIIVAALSFVGSAGGSLLTFRAETNKWERETSFSQKKEIFAKRMELLERTIKIINHLQTLDTYQSVSNYSLVEGGSMVRQNHPAARSLDPVVDSVIKIKEAQAELSVTMTLDALYFGPKTKQAVSELDKALKGAKQWWNVDEAKTQKVIDMLYEELNFS